MAMFLGGLEEAPYAGWTLTDMVSVREKLYLTCPSFDCNTLTGSTAISGTVPTVDFNRWRFTATGEQQLPSAMDVGSGADCDLRVEYDVANLMTSGAAIELKVDFGGTFVSAALNSSMQLVLNRNGSTSTLTGPTDRFGTLRLVKSGSTWDAYFWNVRTRAWSSALSGAQAVSGAGTVRLAATLTTGTLKTHAWGVRNVYPSVTSGNAESPVLDTEDGLRAIGWFTVAGTGSVAVEYRAGDSVASCSGASYSAATTWATITPSSANRFVQVRVSVTGGSTTAASPETGPVMVYSTIDATTAQLLFKRFLAMLVRHTDANYRLTINENASAVSPFTGLWNRAMNGVGQYFYTSNPDSITFEGTTFDLAVYAVEGMHRAATDQTGSSTLLVEASNFLLPGLYQGRTSLLNHANLTEARKDAWTTAIVAQIAVAPTVNWYGFQMTAKSALNALRNVDATSWAVYAADSDYSAAQAALETNHGGDGAWDDFEVVGTNHYDVYTQIIGAQLAQFRAFYPGFGSDPTVRTRIRANAANLRQIADRFGATIAHGRSVHAAGWLQAGYTQQKISDTLNGVAAPGVARELYSRGLWSFLRYSLYPGFDITSLTIDRQGDTASADATYTNYAVINGLVAGYLGEIGYSNVCSARVPETPVVASAHAWPGMGIVQAQGANASDPGLYFNARDFHTAAGPGNRHSYTPRLNATLFALNYGDTAANSPAPRHNGVAIWRDSALSAGNLVMLSNTTAPKCFHCGRVSAVWRSGVGQQWSATVAGTNTATTMTEVHVLYGHHVQALAKIALGARTMTLASGDNMGLPLATGVSLSNVDTTGHAYAENAEGLSTYRRILDAIQTTNRTGAEFYTAEANHNNRRNTKSLTVDTFATGISITGNQYLAVDQAYRHAAMVAADEDDWVGSYTRSTDLITYEADAAGTPVLVLVGLAAQASPSLGNYTLTGASVYAFAASKDAPDWGGASDVTLITYSSQNLVGLATAGNVSWDKLSATKTRVRWDGASNLTAYAAALPGGFNRVHVMDWDGSPVDITSLCTITGESVVVPAARLVGYDFGLVTVDIVAEGGVNVVRTTPGHRPAPFRPGLAR